MVGIFFTNYSNYNSNYNIKRTKISENNTQNNRNENKIFCPSIKFKTKLCWKRITNFYEEANIAISKSCLWRMEQNSLWNEGANICLGAWRKIWFDYLSGIIFHETSSLMQVSCCHERNPFLSTSAFICSFWEMWFSCIHSHTRFGKLEIAARVFANLAEDSVCAEGHISYGRMSIYIQCRGFLFRVFRIFFAFFMWKGLCDIAIDKFILEIVER